MLFLNFAGALAFAGAPRPAGALERQTAPRGRGDSPGGSRRAICRGTHRGGPRHTCPQIDLVAKGGLKKKKGVVVRANAQSAAMVNRPTG